MHGHTLRFHTHETSVSSAVRVRSGDETNEIFIDGHVHKTVKLVIFQNAYTYCILYAHCQLDYTVTL